MRKLILLVFIGILLSLSACGDRDADQEPYEPYEYEISNEDENQYEQSTHESIPDEAAPGGYQPLLEDDIDLYVPVVMDYVES
ncbi:MAG: hypothetical protein FWE11_06905 [Defluviitaleaceae bacterium]|nr:hypothetical protein [Defluviitaleaceae bacterium]